MTSQLTNLLRRNIRPFCNGGATALLLAFFLLGVANLAQGSASQILHTLPPGVASDFAIADFDGDQKPDFATVQGGRASLHDSRYLISFELSTGSKQTIGLTAPIGGLQLDSRDVNGDNLTDLVVSTTWFGRPVAILLNDGHGNFTLMDPSAFPAVTQETLTNWSQRSLQTNDNLAIPPSRSLPKALLTRSTGFFVGDHADSLSGSASRVHVLKRTLNTSGRAPPPAFFTFKQAVHKYVS
jgi:hypothetical protein